MNCQLIIVMYYTTVVIYGAGTDYHSGALLAVLLTSVRHFDFILLAIVLFAFRVMVSDYPFGIFD